MELSEIAEAVAAPTRPKDGINATFNPIFKAAANKEVNITNRDLPIVKSVTPQGPTKLLTINPKDKILRAADEGAYVGPNRSVMIGSGYKNRIMKSGVVAEQSHFVKIE